MQTVQQIKMQIVSALEDSGIFDNVITPTDGRKENTLMAEPAAAVFFSGLSSAEDNGVKMLSANFSVYMKFLKLGVNDTSDDIEAAVNAMAKLEPASIRQQMIKSENSRSTVYLAEISFSGCRQ